MSVCRWQKTPGAEREGKGSRMFRGDQTLDSAAEGLVGHPGRGVREAGGGAGMEIVPNSQGQAHKYGALVWCAGDLRRSSTEPWGPNPQRNQQLRWGKGGPWGPRHMEGMYAGGWGERPCEGFQDASTRRSQAWLSGLAAQGSCGSW